MVVMMVMVRMAMVMMMIMVMTFSTHEARTRFCPRLSNQSRNCGRFEKT